MVARIERTQLKWGAEVVMCYLTSKEGAFPRGKHAECEFKSETALSHPFSSCDRKCILVIRVLKPTGGLNQFLCLMAGLKLQERAYLLSSSEKRHLLTLYMPQTHTGLERNLLKRKCLYVPVVSGVPRKASHHYGASHARAAHVKIQ